MGRSLRYFLKVASPTQENLKYYLNKRGWKTAYFARQADFKDDNLNFDGQAAQCLEYKHLLAQLVQSSCPEVMPLTYSINDYNWPQVLTHIQQQHYQGTSIQAGLRWILKPSLLNNGQHIKIFQNLNDIERHFSTNQRLGGEHVLQYYIHQPHLLNDQRKYSIRMFLILTNYDHAFLYKKGYFNVAKHPYSSQQFNDLRPHLTNEHLLHDESNIIQIPTERFMHFPALYEQIKNLTAEIVQALKLKYPQAFTDANEPKLALFGMDFMVDQTGQVWLLEANHGPCFPTSLEHPLQQHLYHGFWHAFIDHFALPIAQHQINASTYEGFDSLASF